MNIFLMECSAAQWIPCVKSLAKHNVHVSLWTAWDHLRLDILQACPDVVFHDTRDAKIGQGAANYPASFDDICEAVWQEDATTIYEMMSRFDHGRDMITIDMSVLAYRLLSYWRSILKTHAPSLVIFSAPPHVVYDYIVLRLCKKLGIPTLMFEEATVLPPYSISMTDYETGSQRLEKAYEAMLLKDRVSYTEQVEALISRIRSDYDKAIPSREVEFRKTLPEYDDQPEFIQRREAEIEALVALEADPDSGYVHTINTSSWIKQRGVEMRHSFTSKDAGSCFQKQRLQEQLLTLRRKDFYEQLTTSTQTILADDSPMVYFSMAGQPERTSCPQSGLFSNQFVAIALLAEHLPKNWRVIVKEHPNQFHPEMFVNMCRSESYYETIANLPRTYLAAADAPQFELLDKAEFASTTGGTIALEAVIRGKAALVFGSPWYQSCRGISCVKTVKDAVLAIQMAPSIQPVKEDEIRRFFAAIPDGGFVGIADSPPPDFDIGDDLCGGNLAAEILKHIETL